MSNYAPLNRPITVVATFTLTRLVGGVDGIVRPVVAGADGLAVTVNVTNPNGVQVVTGAAATALGNGRYSYDLAESLANVTGSYMFVFATTGTGVDVQSVTEYVTATRYAPLNTTRRTLVQTLVKR